MSGLFDADMRWPDADPDQGRTLVWAHGLASSVSHEDEMGLFDWSAASDVARVLRYDARGHGAADTLYDERCYRWPVLVDDMLRVLPHGPFVAGGADMGCVTALYAAVRAPRRVQALVLAIPPPAWEERPERAELHQLDAHVVETMGLDWYAEALCDQALPPMFAEAFPDMREVHRRQILAMDEKALPAVLRGAAASDLPPVEELRQVIVPTLVLAWEGDPAHPVSTAEALAGLLLQAQLHVARDVAAVRRWPSVVREFLAGLAGP